jgi:hypothetical protein
MQAFALAGVSRGEGVARADGARLLLDYPPDKKIAKGETT